MNVAIILAAGEGERFKTKSGVSKQFFELKGKPVLAYPLQTFNENANIDLIVVAVRENYIRFCEEEVVEKFGLKKVVKVVKGGKERQDSVCNCLDGIKDADYVVIHDGVRPFVKLEVVDRVIEGAKETGACITAIPVSDTLKKVSETNSVLRTVDRIGMWQVQTPQAFKFELITEAYKKAAEEGFYGTDDSMLVEKLGNEIKVVLGDKTNIKITTMEDLKLAEAIVR